MHRLRLSRRHRRLCQLSSEGKPGAALLGSAATPLLGLGLLVGRRLGAVLALTRGSDPELSLVPRCLNWSMQASNICNPVIPAQAGIQGGVRSVGPGCPLSRA
jgi:hypothetical protein